MTSPRIFFLVLLTAACNPFNPDLGSDPFWCGTTEPRCPAGYGPVQVPSGCVCRRTVELPDAGPFMCNDDSPVTNDPGGNDSIANATPTTIGVETNAAFADMSICPDTDRDVFSMTITTGNTMIEALALHDPGQGRLSLAILDSLGAIVAQGIDGADRVTVTYTTPSAGTFYAEVSAPVGVENNYRLELVTR